MTPKKVFLLKWCGGTLAADFPYALIIWLCDQSQVKYTWVLALVALGYSTILQIMLWKAAYPKGSIKNASLWGFLFGEAILILASTLGSMVFSVGAVAVQFFSIVFTIH